MPHMRWALSGLLLVAALGVPVRAEEDPAQPVTPEQRDEHVKRALKPLDEDLAKRFASYEQQGVFSAAVAGWAFLLLEERGAGTAALPARGKSLARIASQVGAYLEKVERFAAKEPKPAAAGAPADPLAGMFSDGTQCNWPTAVAGLFLAEALQRGKLGKEAKAGCVRALRVLEATQQEDGGWGHDDARRGGVSGMDLGIPDPTGRHGKLNYPKTLLSTTNVCATALGALRRALKKEAGDSARKARAYYAAAQNGNGSFPYDPSQVMKGGGPGTGEPGAGGPGMGGPNPADELGAPLTAGALLALRSLGAPDSDPIVRAARAYVDAHPQGLSEGHGSATYGLLLSALEASSRSEAAWIAFRERFLRRLLEAQQKDGTSLCACRHGSFATTCDTDPLPGAPDMPGQAQDARMYVTALHALILALDRVPAKALPAPQQGAGAVPVTTK